MKRTGEHRPLYMISVAAELTGMHPQTLRIYERRHLVNPQRSGGNTRLYSDADIDRLNLINELTAEGINLAGVTRIIEMQREIDRLREEAEAVRAHMAALERAAQEEARARAIHGALVRLASGTVAQRPGR